jgi:molecular chaperone DnaK (HSP70)
MSSHGWTLCVDFGTAFSKAAAAPSDAWANFDPGRVRPLALGSAPGAGVFLLDSAVFVDETRVLFGRAALERADQQSEQKRAALRSFKTILGVSDFDRALNAALPASIDPHRAFVTRDLVVLYLAFLSEAVDRALSADPMLSHEQAFERRYAAPAWRRGDSAGLHGHVMRLFGEADAFRHAIGAPLSRGVAIETAKAALAQTGAAPSASMGLIFEASAAAAYTSIGLAAEAPAMIVLDMGAGTTDIAVLARAGARTEELRDAQLTLKQAGDHIDKIIANIALNAVKPKSQAQRSELWRTMLMHMRDFKETLFAEGKASIRFNGKALTLTLKDFERAKDFRDFQSDLADAYQQALDTARKYALLDGGREIQSVAVGGGASAPFVQAMIRTKPGGKVKVTPRLATPNWAHTAEFGGNLAPVFPQLAIAIGGALAPKQMLAASN